MFATAPVLAPSSPRPWKRRKHREDAGLKRRAAPLPESRTGQLKVTVVEASRGMPTAEIAMGFTLHEPGASARPREAAAPVRAARGNKIVLVTGASGGLGSALVEALCRDYDVLAATHATSLPRELAELPGVEEWRADLSDPASSREALATALGERRLYGVVHAAWPGAPLGGLLQAQDEVLERQLVFGALGTVRLARLLFDHVGPEGGRFVAISSIVATRKPVITLSAYSLGKAALENSVKLLAPELARRKVTINVVGPAFIATGMNKHKGEQQRKLEASRVPLGRLCETGDVAALVGYLLSPGAGFVSGETIALTGGQI